MKSESVFLILALCAAAGACLPSPWAIPGTLLCIGFLLYLGLSALRDSCTDTLTGLRNLRGLQRFRSSIRKDAPISLLYLDVNDLHTLNRQQGHAAGDQLLQKIAADLRSVPGAAAFRIGGDEFLLVRQGICPEQLLSLWRAADTSKAVSAGAATGSAGNWESLLHDAEWAMYRQKEHF